VNVLTNKSGAFHSSVAVVVDSGVPPAATIADVVPKEPPADLEVAKSATSVQLVPFQASVSSSYKKS
jgi:hypothetical protein